MPAVLIIIGLAIVPIVWSLILSFNSADLIAPAEWVGLSNYDALLDDPALRDAIENTIVYSALFVPISIALGLFFAIALNRRIRSSAGTGLPFWPRSSPPLPPRGAVLVHLRQALRGLLGPRRPRAAAPGLPRRSRPGALHHRPDRDLGGIGFPLVIYLAALQDVPGELVDAASVDGARRFGSSAT